MTKVMVEITFLGSMPSMSQIQQKYSLGDSEVDFAYGVQELVGDDYLIYIEENAAGRIKDMPGVKRIYRNLPIGPV